MMFIPIQR